MINQTQLWKMTDNLYLSALNKVSDQKTPITADHKCKDSW